MTAFWHWLARPPYRGIPWLVLAYVILSCLMFPTGGVWTGHLVGYDDQVRMVQVLNWVNGAGWYDRTIMRADPPEGFTTIWSRIVDIPFAAIVVVAQLFVAQKTAALISAVIMPLVYLALLFAAAPYFVRPLVGKKYARLIILFLPFTSILNVKYFSASGFLIGQASHHPWYIILTLTMFGAATRLAMGCAGYSPVFILGGSIALLTAVGIEGYPLIAASVAIVTLVAWAGNRVWVAGRAAAGVFCGAVGSLILLPMHQPPEKLFTISFAEPSILGVILISAAALFLLVEQQLLRVCAKRYISAPILCLTAGFFAAVLVYAFPELLNGAAAGLSTAERQMAFAEHLEAGSLYKVSSTTLEFICLIVPTIIAVVAGAYALLTTKNVRRRSMSFCYWAFAAVGGGMSGLFSRYYHHAMTTSCAWLVWLWLRIQSYLKTKRFFVLTSTLTFIILGPLTMLLIPAVAKQLPVLPGIVFFPAGIQAFADACDTLPLADYINTHYGPDTILSVPNWISQQMLYQTDVRLDFLANYPSHDRFIDNYRFFGYRYYGYFSPDISRQIAAKHNIDLVAVCSGPSFYEPSLPEDKQTFIGLLQVGKAPAWLKPVQMDIQTNYLLFEVDKNAVNQQVSP